MFDNVDALTLHAGMWAIEEAAAEAAMRSMAAKPGGILPGNNGTPYTVTPEGKAIVPVVGALLNIPGRGADYSVITRAAAAADKDPAVKLVEFQFDSPGGLVSGAYFTARTIEALETPTVALVTGQCASAAYWLAAACDKIVASPVASVGCLGVMMTLMESKAADKAEVRFVSSNTPLKAAKPSEAAGANQYQTLVDDQSKVMMTEIARMRDVSVTDISRAYGLGVVLSGTRALQLGLVDELTGGAEGPTANTRGEDMAEKKVETKAEAPEAVVDAPKAAEPTPEERVAELEQLVKELEEKLAAKEEKPEDTDAEPDAEPEAAAEEVDEEEKPEEPEAKTEAELKLEARIEGLEAKAYAAERELAVGELLSAGTLAPHEEAVAVALYDGEKAGTHKLFTETYVGRTEAAVDLTQHSHGGEGVVLEPGSPEAIRATAQAYCAANDIPTNGQSYYAVLTAAQNGNLPETK